MVTGIIATLSGTNKDIHAELLLDTYTASGEQTVIVQPRLSALNAAAASITIRCEHTLGNDTVLAYEADVCTKAKFAAANTAFGYRAMGPFTLLNGEKLKIYALSTNASDTTASYSIVVLDANPVIPTLDAGVDLVDAPNATAVTAIQSGLAVPGDEMDLVNAPNDTALAAIVAKILADNKFNRAMAVLIGNRLLNDAQTAANFYDIADTDRTTRIHGFVYGSSGADAIGTVDSD